ncbi:hypothetical protein Hdeb2414_s0013g00407551 [Helianthus debilis subsp. tardiflorus]
MLDDLYTSSLNENEALRKQVEALRADKVIKDEQLNMLYTVIEHKLGFNVQAVFDEIEIHRVEARRAEREKRLAEKAAESKKDKKKGLVIDTEEILGTTSQPNPAQTDEVNVSNLEASNVNEVEMREAEDVVDDTLSIIPVGELKDVTPEEIKLNRRKIIEKRHQEEEVEDEEDDELKELFDDIDNYDGEDNDDDDDDDDDQGATGLMIVKPSGQYTLDDFLNDELNEQQEDQHHEASSSGTQHAGEKVYLTLPKVIYLHAEVEGELEENRTRESMLEELGMDGGNMNFDIKDEIPPSPEREYSFKFVNEADNFKDVIIEEDSDLSEEDTPFHYTGVDEDFPTLSELFQSYNEDEVRRKVVERISAEGVPETVPQEKELLEGRKRWFKVMLKERKYKRPLQYFTDHREKSLGDIFSWGYLEDLKVYAIKREHGVQYFEFLSHIKTPPWWDVEKLVQTKNIKQFYYGLEVKMHDQKLWNYIKLQAKENFPDWKPHRPEQVAKIDPITGEKGITLKIKPPRCLKNMMLRAIMKISKVGYIIKV